MLHGVTYFLNQTQLQTVSYNTWQWKRTFKENYIKLNKLNYDILLSIRVNVHVNKLNRKHRFQKINK